MDRLEQAMYTLEKLGRNGTMSIVAQDEAIRKQYEYIIHVLVGEVQELKRLVVPLENR